MTPLDYQPLARRGSGQSATVEGGMMTTVDSQAFEPGPNLIVNGSFENFAANNSRWSGWTGLTELEGWTLSGTAARNTNWFEPHSSGYGGVQTSDGRAMLDLGTSPGNVSISQTLDTLAAGATYTLTFSLAEAGSGNAVQVLFDGVEVGTFRGGNRTMTEYSVEVTATSNTGTITFREVGRADNTGTYIDNVQLVQTGPSDADRQAAAEAEAARVEAEKVAAEKLAAEQAAAEAKAAAEQAAAEQAAKEQAAKEQAAEEKAAAEKAEAEKVAAEKAAAEKAAALAAELEAAKEAARVEAEKRAAEQAAEEKAAAEQAAAEKLAADVAAFEAAMKAEAARVAAEEAAARAQAEAEAAAKAAAAAAAVLKGTDGADELWGASTTTQIQAGGGNDFIVSGGNGARIDGGDGFNTLSYQYSEGERGVIVDVGQGVATNAFGARDSFANIQRVVGSDQRDELFAGSTDAVMDGGAGADYMSSAGGRSTMFGGSGNDELVSSMQANDTMWSRSDTMVGGQGNDAFVNLGRGLTTVDYSQDGGARGVTVNLSSLANEFAIDSWGGRDLLWNIGIVKGTDQNDVMIGGSRDIVIFDGGAGDDTLTAGSGGSEIYGGAGNDFITGGNVSSGFLEGGAGDDTINVGQGYTVIGLYGADGSDVVNGFKSTDSLRVYNSSQTADELAAGARYHMAEDGRDGMMFTYGDTEVFLAGVYELRADQIQFMNV
jgi:Ca2+-binding RTX toxin-like protein